MVKQLKDSAGNFITIQEGESCNLTGTLKDTSGSTVASPLTFTLTYYDLATGGIINSRKDENVASTLSAGSYVIEFDANDTVILGDHPPGTNQIRIARLEFTYDDGDSTRTGVEEFSFPVEKMPDAVGIGGGGNAVTITLTDADSVIIPDVKVWITSDIAGRDIIAGPLLTNTSGEVVFNLASGVIYRWAEKSSYTFTNPATITVA